MKNESSQNVQKMGLLGAIALVFSGMVGSGILFLPHAMAHCGSWGFFSWILGALMSYSMFLSFAGVHSYLMKTAKKISSPDILDYLQLRYCSNTSFALTYGHFLAMAIAAAITAVALGDYFKGLYPSVILCAKSIGTLSLFLMFFINLISFGAANVINVWLNVVKILFFFLLSVFSVSFAPSYQFNFGSLTLLFSGAAITMFAFMGIEMGILASGSMENPEKNAIEATKWGLLFASIIFLGVYSATMFILADLSLTKTPVYDAAIVIFGSIGARIIGVVAILSCLTSLNGNVVVQGNSFRNFAKKGYLPAFFEAETNQGFPWRGALLSLFISATLIWLPFKLDLGILAVTLVGVFYLSVVILDILLNGYSFTALLAFISCVIMLCNINLMVAVFASGIYAFGYLLKQYAAKENK